MAPRKGFLLVGLTCAAIVAVLWRTGVVSAPSFLGGGSSSYSSPDPDAVSFPEDESFDFVPPGLSAAPPSAKRTGPSDAIPAARPGGVDDPAALATLAGEILRSDGRTAAYARVLATESAGATEGTGKTVAATADADGRFKLDLPKGRYDLAIRSEGGALFLRSFLVDGRPFLAPLRLGAAGDVRVDVTRAGLPLADVPVRARLSLDGAFATIAEGKTDGAGVYVADALPTGTYVVEADAASGVVASRQLDLTGSATVSFAFPETVRVTGLVTDADTGLPVAADVAVVVGERAGVWIRAAGKTSADGSFALDVPKGNPQTVLVTSAEFAPYPAGREERNTAVDALKSLREGQPATIAVALHRGAVARGLVTLAGSKDPVSNLALRFVSGRSTIRSAVTTADGTYEVRGLAVGAHAVLLETPGWYPKGDVQVRVPATGAGPAPIDLVRDFEVESAGALSGVVASPDGAPVPGARVWLSGGNGAVRGARRAGREVETLSDRDGAFALDDVPLAQTVRVRASFGDAEATPSREIRLADGVAAPVRLVLGPTGRIEGRVTDLSTREPLSGVRVQAYAVGEPAGREGRGVMTTADGRFELAGLLPGLWRLVPTRRRDYLPGGYVEVEVTGGASAAASALTLDPGLALGGEVVDVSGNAVPGARVALSGAEEGGTPPSSPVSKNASADARGAFRWQGLRFGDYTLVVAKGGFVTARLERLRGGEQRLRVVLSPGSTSSGGSR